MQTPNERHEALNKALAQIEENFGKNKKLKPRTQGFPYKKGLLSFEERVGAVLEEASELLVTKQNDYGPLNISRAPGGPLNGLRVRIFDKVARINNLIDSGVVPEHESLRDSFIDLANYAVIALMVIDGVWPEMERNV